MVCSIVTGGARGIGRSIAAQLQQRGDTVVVFDCLQEQDDAVAALRAAGFMYLQVDVSAASSVAAAFAALDAQGLQPRVLVNNAGITRDGLVLRMSEADWQLPFDVNVKGAFLCSQQALKRMIKLPKSYVINISSVVALSGNQGQANYAASKAALEAFTKSLALEYASRHVLVNAIAPGFIQTAMTDALPESVKHKALELIPLRRVGQPEDVAHLVAFLTSGQADYITRQVLVVSGGM
jgi:3-oxoacyl-[acyl-carrier protein] reductase